MEFRYKHQDVYLPGERKKKKRNNSNYPFTQEYYLPGEQEPSLWDVIWDYLSVILLAFALGYFINHVLITNAYIPSGSMEPTIMTGDRIVGNRLAYLNAEPQRGDIIIFPYPDNEKDIYIKRIIGLPGDTIVITNGKVYINDSETPLEEPYLQEDMIGSFGPFTVPEDSYFMMGDNRNDSWDSRFWDDKFVHRDDIQSKAVIAVFPHPRILE